MLLKPLLLVFWIAAWIWWFLLYISNCKYCGAEFTLMN